MSVRKIKAPESVQKLAATTISRARIPLYNADLFKDAGESFNVRLQKEINDSIAESSRPLSPGEKMHPFNTDAVVQFMNSNPHHSTCIHAKIGCTVGLGFQTEEQRKRIEAGDSRPQPHEQSKVDEELDKLCDISFQDVLTTVTDDFWERGTGLLEVKRDKPKQDAEIIGLHYIPFNKSHIKVEDTKGHRHWVIGSEEGADRQFALFGDLEAYLARNKVETEEQASNVSEVIMFRIPTIRSRWYGFPDYLSAVAPMELDQCMTQERFDFYLNRGVPDFLLFVLGQELEKDKWKKIEDALKANIGLGNSHKTTALNFANKELVIQLHKLGSERAENEYGTTGDAIALKIVSAHRTPPLLAGIQIPGKLGATNELPNALLAFQLLVIGPAQRIFQQTLRTTLGNEAYNGKLGLDKTDFTFNRIVDMMNLQAMETIGGMRQTLPEAQQQGRNLNAGMKD